MLHRERLADGFARQILATVRPFLHVRDEELEVLDVGCGYGFTTAELATSCRPVVGIEPSFFLYEAAVALRANRGLDNLEIRHGAAADLVECETFDLVVLDNVLEHVANQALALARISAALKSGGAIFIVVPNKLWPLDVHYGLPFLSYLPLPLANRYLRLTRQGIDYTDASYAPAWLGLRRLLADRPDPSYRFIAPADLPLATLGSSLHYRIGTAALRRCPWLWTISKMLVVVAVKR